MVTPDRPERALPPADAVTTAPGFVFRNATVVSVDPAIGTLEKADVLVVGDTIAAVGPSLDVTPGTVAIDASGGIVIPGMIDTHRHMWQTLMRGFGADWTLTNYFYFYYLEWGQAFRPEEVYAGNLLAGLDSLDAGVTTTLDWSHGCAPPITPRRGSTRSNARRPIRVRYGTSPKGRGSGRRGRSSGTSSAAVSTAAATCCAGRWPSTSPAIRRSPRDRPSPWPANSAHASPRTAGVGRDLGPEHPVDGRARIPDRPLTHVHVSSLSEDSYQRIAASGGHASVATESECSAGQGYSPTARLRKYGIPISLSVDTSSWWSGDMFWAMRATLNADRAREHLEAHREGRR